MNIFQYNTIKMRTMNFKKQINILNKRFVAIMEKYEVMIMFVDGIVNNPRYAETYVRFDPIILEIINKIKDFQTTLANIFNVELDELNNENATIPQDLQKDIENDNRRN
jgi:hypothetical protein